jgi:hypothetical protein
MNTIVIEIKLVKSEVIPGTEKTFIKAFEMFGKQIQASLLKEQNLATDVTVKLR